MTLSTDPMPTPAPAPAPTKTASAPDLFIGMPVYNGERYLREALDSILAQSYRNFALLVSDNASTDGSPGICAEYAARDPRIRYVRQPATVPSREHFLYLVKEATLPYFMWAACDDEWHPRFCEELVGAHRKNPSLALAFSPYALTDEGGRAYGKTRFPDYAGRTPTARIARLCRQWDDGVFYGVFRRSALDGLEFPVWWGKNRTIPLNVAYPPLCYVLSRGDYALVGREPMWFNRQHATKPYAESVFANRALESATYLLRVVNLEAECVKQVYRATGSAVAAAQVVPAVGARVSFEVGWKAAYATFSTGRRVVRKFRPA